MRRHPNRSILAALVLAGAACGGADAAGPPLLVLDTTAGTAVVDTTDGALVQLARGGAATPDGEVVFDTRPTGQSTAIRATAVADNTVRWRSSLTGRFEARVASADGRALALGPPRTGLPPLEPGTLAPGRAATVLAIVRADGTVQQLGLQGNVEPEAFSIDGAALFVVDYQPAGAPTHYQVRRLDLATGELGDVYSVDAELQRSMRGTARTQVWDPEGDRLYTLYTLDSGTAFVHVLDLEEQWAHCVDLPAGIGASTAGMALSDDGQALYVADATGGGGIAEVDTGELRVVDEGRLPAAGADAGPSVLALQGRDLFVGSGGAIDVVDRGSLEPGERYRTSGPILGLQGGAELYVALSSAIVALDPETGEVIRTMPVSVPEGLVVSIGGHSVPSYAGIECAC